MELIKQHVEKFLTGFVSNSELELELFSKIDNHPQKIRFKKLLNYVNKLIDLNFGFESEQINALHIHFDKDFDREIELIISQLIIIKLFIYHQSQELQTNQNGSQNSSLLNKIEELKWKYNSLDARCPEGAKASKGGNKIYKNWVQKKKEINCLLSFYKSLHQYSTFSRKALVNSKVGIKNELLDIFNLDPIITDIDSNNFEFVYNIFNSEYTLSDIDLQGNLVDNIEDIILFDCESKKVMSNYSLEEIKNWNKDYGTKFQRFLLITFGKDNQSFNNTRTKINTVKERFKIQDETYTILSSEIDTLLKRKKKVSIPIAFIGFDTCSFWNNFLLETSIRDLYELRSIKLMNIYSLCLTEEIKNYILEDIFSKKEMSELISFSTKEAILELQDDDVNLLRDSLSNTLESILSSEIKSKIHEQLCGKPLIILDEAIIKNEKLLSRITQGLELTKSIKIKAWSDLQGITSNNILILSYRDQGKYPYFYYPNLVEYCFNNDTAVAAILPKFFYKSHYQWSQYNLLKDYHNYFGHSIRQEHFGWNQLKIKIKSQRPETKQNIDWHQEYEYSYSEQRETYKIKVIAQRIKTFNASDLLIFSEKSEKKPRIEKVKWLIDNLNLKENDYEIQKLDDLLDEFNPAEKLIDTTQQEKELDIIRKQLKLENETAGRIWKVLLKRESTEIGVEEFYNKLKKIFEKNNISLVSLNHFQNSWINIEDDSLMPRGNKVFKVLCNYLELNNNYRIILYSLKNASVSGKIEATKKYSKLLKDLFADSYFDNNVSPETKLKSKIEYYKNNHNLDELGIDYENPLRGLLTLIELIQPEIKLLKLESIEKIE